MALECCVCLSCNLRYPDLQFIQNFKWFKAKRSIVRKVGLYVDFQRHWFSIIKHKWFNTHSGISWEMRILIGFDWMPGNLPLKTSLLLAAETPKTIDSRRCINFAQTDALFKFHFLCKVFRDIKFILIMDLMRLGFIIYTFELILEPRRLNSTNRKSWASWG